jgi:hypothetical protein
MAPLDPDLDPDDLELDIAVRSPAALADRLVMLAAVCRRAFLEHGLDAPEDDSDDDTDDRPDDPETQRYDLAAWLRDEGIAESAANYELDFIDAPVGAVGEADAALASWESESLVAVAWAAGLIPELPGYASPADPALILSLVPDAWDKTAAFRAELSPLDDQTVASARESAELWYWRAGVEAMARSASRSESAHLRKIAAETAAEAKAAGLLADTAKGDFAIGGNPISRIDDDALDILASIAERRLRALNWCSGFGESWADAPLDLD